MVGERSIINYLEKGGRDLTEMLFHNLHGLVKKYKEKLQLA
jgi:hypothetical protein